MRAKASCHDQAAGLGKALTRADGVRLSVCLIAVEGRETKSEWVLEPNTTALLENCIYWGSRVHHRAFKKNRVFRKRLFSKMWTRIRNHGTPESYNTSSTLDAALCRSRA